jgi:uncharacterized OsmC-like protein
MATRVDVTYDGDLHCTAIHELSGDRLLTDAPPDNRGKGEHFSPTDLLGTALGTCTLTIMGIAARDRGIDLTGARLEVFKEMGASPRRHIAKLTVNFLLPEHLDEQQRKLMEQAALTCPVHASLGERTQVELNFRYEPLGVK